MKSHLCPGPYRETIGTETPTGNVRLAVGFNPTDYERLKLIAKREGIPVATAARQLVQIGMAQIEAHYASRTYVPTTAPSD